MGLTERLLEASNKNDKVPVIADVTASSEVQENYFDWLNQGISVVAANKGIFAGPETKYRELITVSKTKNAKILHETTVGAGLPILGTIQDLVASSHKIIIVEGIL